MAALEPDICVIGAGSGGLSVAYGASQMGATTVLIERHRMGGDCLNTGCVPSKALLAAAKAAEDMRHASAFGVNGHAPAIDFAAVHRHVHGVIAAIEPHDSVARYEGLGVRVIQAGARFADARTVIAGEHTIRARRFVVATGSAPAVPPIPGLDGVQYLTNETVFGLTEAPGHLVVLGGGPVGCELAQAHRRLGCRVSLIEMASLLPRDDPELVAVLRDRLVAEGIDVHEGARAEAVERVANGIAVRAIKGGTTIRVEGTHLLVATGRRPVVDGLELDAAGIAHDAKGITVDAGLRTSNRRVYAIGDVTGGLQFTHVASHHASVVLRSALFRLPARAETRAVPWATFTDPELAVVGQSEAAARRAGADVQIARFDFGHIDRAIAERRTEGLVKVVATRRGRVLGTGIVGPHAGELLQPWVIALKAGVSLSTVARTIVPYPTFAEVGKRAASAFFAPRVFGPGTRRLVRLLARLG
ncbi:MAG: FAD-dependent oxidoreductase [Alphaproteobacteria bacterium]